MGYVDKIILSSCRTTFTVFTIDGQVVTINFQKLGMTVMQGLDYVEGLFNGTILLNAA